MYKKRLLRAIRRLLSEFVIFLLDYRSMLIEGGSEEVVEIEAVGLAVVGVEAGIAGEVAEDMQLNPSGEVGV